MSKYLVISILFLLSFSLVSVFSNAQCTEYNNCYCIHPETGVCCPPNYCPTSGLKCYFDIDASSCDYGQYQFCELGGIAECKNAPDDCERSCRDSLSCPDDSWTFESYDITRDKCESNALDQNKYFYFNSLNNHLCPSCNNPTKCSICCFKDKSRSTTTSTTSTITSTTSITSTSTSIPEEVCNAVDDDNDCWDLPVNQRDSGNNNGDPCDCEQNVDKYGDHRVVCDPGVDEGWTYELYEDNKINLDLATLYNGRDQDVTSELRSCDDNSIVSIPSDDIYYIELDWNDIWNDITRERQCNSESPGDSVYCHVYDVGFFVEVLENEHREITVQGLVGNTWEDLCSFTSVGRHFCNLNDHLLRDQDGDGVTDLYNGDIKLRLEIEGYDTSSSETQYQPSMFGRIFGNLFGSQDSTPSEDGSTSLFGRLFGNLFSTNTVGTNDSKSPSFTNLFSNLFSNLFTNLFD